MGLVSTKDKKQVKIAIVTHKMVMGGIEKSLIELCEKLLVNEIDVTLYVDAVGGELYNEIPEKVKVVDIFEKYKSMKEIFMSAIKRKSLKAVYAGVKSIFYNHFSSDPVKGWKAVAGYIEEVNEQYDYAFAYGAPVSFSVIFVDCILNAKKKYAWIHNDPREISLDIKKYRKLFIAYDKLVCVSQSTKKNLIALLPEYESKTMVFYNIINSDKIKKYSQDFSYDDGFLGTKILTVGRLCDPKGQDIIPVIMKKLLSDGYNVRWYCIGEGENRIKIEKLIKQYSVEKNVMLLGNKNNPYPFFRMADIYVQPSRHEGFGITVSEAKIFGLPIIATDFDGANEQIENGETGFIVEFDVPKIYSAIIKLIDDKQIAAKFLYNMKNDKKSCVTQLKELL